MSAACVFYIPANALVSVFDQTKILYYMGHCDCFASGPSANSLLTYKVSSLRLIELQLFRSDTICLRTNITA